jgi:hypothetical protein
MDRETIGGGQYSPSQRYSRRVRCSISVRVIRYKPIFTSSVADPGCLSPIPDPDFYPSRIPDPKTATKERDEKKCVVIPFYVATNFTKLKIILVLKS